MKDHLNIHSVNPIYCIINDVDEHIEESNGNKYLILLLLIQTKKY